jgi:hypothetical protein
MFLNIINQRLTICEYAFLLAFNVFNQPLLSTAELPENLVSGGIKRVLLTTRNA